MLKKLNMIGGNAFVGGLIEVIKSFLVGGLTKEKACGGFQLDFVT